MTNKGGTGCRQRTIVQTHWSIELDLVNNIRELSRHLHGCFYRVNGHNHDTKQGCGHTGSHRLETNIEIFGGLEIVHGSQDTRVGGGVSESTEWACNGVGGWVGKKP